VSIKTSKTEKCAAGVTPSAFPLKVINPAQVTKFGARASPRLHQIIDCCSQTFPRVIHSKIIRATLQNLTCAMDHLMASLLWDYLCPAVTRNVLTAAPTQIAQQAQVKVTTLCTTYVAIPDSGTAEVAGRNHIVRNLHESNFSRRNVFDRFIANHLMKKAAEKREVWW